MLILQYLMQCSYVTMPNTSTALQSTAVLYSLITATLLLYLVALYLLQRQHKHWSRWRVCSFVSAIAMLLIVIYPSTAVYAHYSFTGHMLQHLIIGMLAPIGLVMGAPVTLFLKALPPKASKYIASLLKQQFFHVLCHPVTALLLNTGSMFILYLTPLYKHIIYAPGLHYFMHLHFLLAGYLFTWSVIGPDPAPKRPDLRVRLFVLFISIAAHAYLSKLMYAYRFPRVNFYNSEDIRQAAQLMYYGGDLSELILLIILFTIWYRKNKLPRYKIGLLMN